VKSLVAITAQEGKGGPAEQAGQAVEQAGRDMHDASKGKK